MNRQELLKEAHVSMYAQLWKYGYIAPVKVLIDTGVLSKKDYSDWRYGNIACLEDACRYPFHELSFLIKEIKAFAKGNRLKPTITQYSKWGADAREKLAFSRAPGQNNAYEFSTYFIKPGRMGAYRLTVVNGTVHA